MGVSRIEFVAFARRAAYGIERGASMLCRGQPGHTATAGSWPALRNRVARLSLACNCARMSNAFNSVVSAARHDDRIVGLVLGGSRGKGLGNWRSDYDVYLVVADETDPSAIASNGDYRDGIDLVGVWTASAFAAYAIGDGNDWNRYNFAHLRPPIDKPGSIQGLCDAKEWLPATEARATAAGLLDAYMNYRFRAAKNHVDGNLEAAALDAAESSLVLLDFIFTAERRARPYNKFLSWELATHPLANDWGIATLPSTTTELVRTADAPLQANCFQAVEKVARQLGYDAILDAWRPSELAQMRSESH